MRAFACLSQAAAGESTALEVLRALCEAAVEALQVDGAGVVLRYEDGDVLVHSAGAEVAAVARLQHLQQALGDGPGSDCLARAATVVSEDLVRDERWTPLRPVAAEVHLHAVAALPLLSAGRGWGVLSLYRCAAGEWGQQELLAAQALAGVAASYLQVAHDRDQAREAQRVLAHQAMHDELTGLPNRALLFDRLDHALATAARRANGVAVVFLDLDLFKAVNDTFGHTAADGVLVEVARRLTTALRAGDTLARFAGDEFVIVCEGLPQGSEVALHERVAALSARLQRVLHTPVRVGEVDVVLSASTGVAITTGAVTARELLADADAAMYTAKQAGRGRVSIRDHSGAGAPPEGRVPHQPARRAGSRRIARSAPPVSRQEAPGDSPVLAPPHVH